MYILYWCNTSNIEHVRSISILFMTYKPVKFTTCPAVEAIKVMHNYKSTIRIGKINRK